MPNTVKEHDLDSLLEELVASQQGKDPWTRRVCWTKDLAQDQKAFGIREDRSVRIYYGVRKGTDEDAQSESTAIGGSHAYEEYLRVLSNALREKHARIEHSYGVLAYTWEMAGLVDVDVPEVEAAYDDGVCIPEPRAEEWTSDRLADELLKLHGEEHWPRLRELILTAEDFGFTLDQSAQLAPRLLDLAVEYRDSNGQQDAPVVWSAVRTGASMLRPNEASRLLALLEPGHPIETGLVALKMLGRIFEAQPPERLDQYADLAGEVRGIAQSLLNRYAIASSESAAMAQLAVYTLAAMASNETLPMVQAVRGIGVSWFSQQTARELRELQSSWNARSVSVAPDVLGLLERAMSELQAN